MRIELLLQIAVATMTALGTLLLGMGERSMTLPVIAMIVSASSVYLTDVSGYLRLNARVANIAGSTAVVIFVWDFLQRFGNETQLLAVANLLIYLQFVLLYQRKSESTYWLLVLLSLLQVAVATALNFEVLFGFLLLAYLVVGLTAMGLFYLHREVERCDEHQIQRVDPTHTLSETQRWPLAVAGSTIRTGWQRSDEGEALGWRFVRQMSGLTMVTLTLALAFFFAVPRMNQSTWQNRPGVAQAVTGAAQEVTLGELGTIIESPEKVMTVSFYKEGNREAPYLLTEAPLFRGPTLTDYRHGRWSHPAQRVFRVSAPIVIDPPPGSVMQEMRLQPQEVDTIYCVAPIIGLANDHHNSVLFDEESQQLSRARSSRDQTVRIHTLGIQNGRQVQFLPNTVDWMMRQWLLEFPEAELPRLTELARSLVQDIPPDDSIARARALFQYLHSSNLFRYSLSAPSRNPDIDPVEDFLFEHREGHCEYYASALTLMLRAVGIPARMVLGFNGGEWNSLGGFYLVRELHAHAWVEAYVPERELPESMRGGEYDSGAWMTLDPTPGSSGATSRIGTVAGMPTFRQFVDYARYLWSSYIMGMDSERQLRTIYEPLLKWLVATWKTVSDLEAWGKLINRWALRLGIDDPRAAQMVFFASLFALAAALVLRAWRLPIFIAKRLWRAATGREWRARRAASPVVEFYRRLEALLARQGIRRPDAMTQHEFAQSAATRLASAGLPGLAMAPLQVADAFYQVRFGGQRLDNQQQEAVEKALSALDQASRGAAGQF